MRYKFSKRYQIPQKKEGKYFCEYSTLNETRAFMCDETTTTSFW